MSILYIVGTIAGQRVAIDAGRVGSVIDVAEIVPIPLAPLHLLGLCAVRSQILTVIDPAVLFGALPDRTPRRAITLQLSGQHYAVAMTQIEDVIPCDGNILPTDPSIGEAWDGLAAGTIETTLGLALLITPESLICAPMDRAA